jgi:hypothetical protein
MYLLKSCVVRVLKGSFIQSPENILVVVIKKKPILLITAIHRFWCNCYQNNPITCYSIRLYDCSRDLQLRYK